MTEPIDVMDAAARIRELEQEVVRLRAAQSAASQLHAILDGSPQAILIHRGAAPLYVNLSFVRLVGLASREEALRLPNCIEVAHPEDRAFVIGQVEARIAGRGFLQHYEARILDTKGATIWVDCYASRIVWDGEPAAMVTMTDITLRKKIEAAQRRSEKLLSTVFRMSPDPISLTTMKDGRYVDVNESFLKALGWRRADVVGRTSTEIGFWKDSDFRQRMVEALKRDGFVRDLPGKVRQPNGEVRDFIYSVDVIQFEEENLLLGIGRDVTELKRSADRLRESMESAELANRAKSEFLANMSHELRTPLNAILGFSEIIGGEMFGPTGHPRYVDYAKDIYTSGRMLLQIIDDLLDLSRVEHGKLELHPERLTAKDVIEGCLRLVDGRARDARLRIATELPELPLRFEADPLRLRQVLLNLLTNAIKFTPAGGNITIGANRIDGSGEIRFFVADTGIGMTEAEMALALQPFGQAANAMTREHSGAGLGVPLAKGLVELHGGTLVIESKPSQGTRVTVTLPEARRLPAAEPNRPVRVQHQAGITAGGFVARG
ncbi:PAS domain-containing sensor histidine kinase [Dongia sedimenti]|uniref:histidine kinase n=1 Tax=Dongia sedimenti TaxID=3064282 RepID=A0ABU0YUW2_9PROT|nr:PAS domain-containing sensor histidine kinase [Rhodospirillaceae bacterium R-7]